MAASIDQQRKRLIIKLSYTHASQKCDDDSSHRDNNKKRKIEKPIVSCYWLDSTQPLQNKDTVLSHTQQTNNNIKGCSTTPNSVPVSSAPRMMVTSSVIKDHIASAEKSGLKKIDGDGMIKKDTTKKKTMEDYKRRQCWVIVKRMIEGKDGWALKNPLDSKFLNGSKVKATCLKDIEEKLKSYSTPDEFADDMRFVFCHGMCYPRRDDVHRVAARLSDIFENRWKDLKKEWALEEKRLKNKNLKRKSLYLVSHMYKKLN